MYVTCCCCCCCSVAATAAAAACFREVLRPQPLLSYDVYKRCIVGRYRDFKWYGISNKVYRQVAVAVEVLGQLQVVRRQQQGVQASRLPRTADVLSPLNSSKVETNHTAASSSSSIIQRMVQPLHAGSTPVAVVRQQCPMCITPHQITALP